MLKLTIPESKDNWDEKTQTFVSLPEVALELEHSLVSLSKWESSFEKAFLSDKDKTDAETIWYVKAMTLTPDVPDEVYDRLTTRNIDEVNKYIAARMTATWFSERTGGSKKPPPKETITSELIYYWMIALNIPFECQHWHLNRLLTLIEVCNRKNAPQKKMSKAEIAARNRQLNAERRRKYGTSG